jgi:hypothetical protein
MLFISAINVLMDDNLCCLWQHIQPMNVFGHCPEAIIFPIIDHLIALMLREQDVNKICNFVLWIL